MTSLRGADRNDGCVRSKARDDACYGTCESQADDGTSIELVGCLTGCTRNGFVIFPLLFNLGLEFVALSTGVSPGLHIANDRAHLTHALHGIVTSCHLS